MEGTKPDETRHRDCRLSDVEQAHGDKRRVISCAAPMESVAVFFPLREIRRIQENISI